MRLSSGRTIQLRERVKLSAEEVGGLGSSTRASTVAEVSPNPNEPAMLGLKNLSGQAWSVIRLVGRTTINFGLGTGAIREEAGEFSLSLASGQSIVLREGIQLSVAGLLDMQSSAAEVVRNPNEPTILRRKNVSHQVWVATALNGGRWWVEPGRSIKLAIGTTIDFGSIRGEIQVEAGARALVDRLRDSLPGSPRSWAVAGCIILAVLAALIAGIFHAQPVRRASSPGMSTIARELAASSEGLATVRFQPRSISAGLEGATLSLDDGAAITAPKRAFGRIPKLHTAILDLTPQRISSDLQQAWMYMVAMDDDFTCLRKLVVLEVPQPSDRVIASVGDGEIGGALIFPQDQRQESRLVIFRLSTLPLLRPRTQLTKYLTSQAVFSWPWKA